MRAVNSGAPKRAIGKLQEEIRAEKNQSEMLLDIFRRDRKM